MFIIRDLLAIVILLIFLILTGIFIYDSLSASSALIKIDEGNGPTLLTSARACLEHPVLLGLWGDT